MATYESAVFSKSAWGTVSDADFRAWGAACEDAIAGAGLTLESSSVDWGTATISGTATTFNAGDSAIYRFNDGLEEVYIQFEWGRGNTTGSNQFAMRVRIGVDAAFAQGSSTVTHLTGIGAGAITDYSWHACFVDGCFILTESSNAAGSTYNPYFLIVERSRDIDGTPNDDAVIMCVTGMGTSTTLTSNASATNRRIIFDPFSTATPSAQHLLSASLTTVTSGVDSAVPVVWGYNGILTPMRSALALQAATAGTFQNFTIDDNGTNRTYRTNSLPAQGFFASNSSYRIAYRWE